jgi:DNA replication protein DnaC
VIDDWGTERNTPFMKEIITKVINNRYNSEKPLIITTNLDVKNILEDLQEKKELDRKNIRKMTEEEIYLSRLYSRFSEMCVFIHVKGKDRRQHGII